MRRLGSASQAAPTVCLLHGREGSGGRWGDLFLVGRQIAKGDVCVPDVLKHIFNVSGMQTSKGVHRRVHDRWRGESGVSSRCTSWLRLAWVNAALALPSCCTVLSLCIGLSGGQGLRPEHRPLLLDDPNPHDPHNLDHFG